jgi:hypothetical protein
MYEDLRSSLGRRRQSAWRHVGAEYLGLGSEDSGADGVYKTTNSTLIYEEGGGEGEAETERGYLCK